MEFLYDLPVIGYLFQLVGYIIDVLPIIAPTIVAAATAIALGALCGFMNERSGETTSNDELEARGAIVKVVLFPLVVKKGDEFGEGEDEIVVCPAQVLIAKPGRKKVVRVMSGAMSLGSRASSKGRSAVSLAPESSVMDLDEPNMI